MGWEDPLEKEVATRSSILACRFPLAEEYGKLQSIGSQRVGHDWSGWACLMHKFSMSQLKVFSPWPNPISPPISCVCESNTYLLIPWSSCQEKRCHSSQTTKQLHFCFLPTSPVLSHREPARFCSLKVPSHSLSWHGSINMSMLPLQPHPSPFLFLPCLYRTIQSHHLSHTSSQLQTFASDLFDFQGSAFSLSPVRSISFLFTNSFWFITVLSTFYGSCLMTSWTSQLFCEHLQVFLVLASPRKMAYGRYWLKPYKKMNELMHVGGNK